jgi:arylsulfatase A-like enzyme
VVRLQRGFWPSGAVRSIAPAIAPALALVLSIALAGCGEAGSTAPARSHTGSAPASGGGATTIVHLADALGAAQVSAGTPPAGGRPPRVWSFAEPRPEWHVVGGTEHEGFAQVRLEPQPDGLRLVLAPADPPQGMLRGGIAADLDAGRVDDWSALLVRARSHERFSGLSVAFNLDDPAAFGGGFQFMMGGEGSSPVFNDGSVQEYLLPIKARTSGEALRSLALVAGSPGPGAAGLELLSMALVPRGAEFDQGRDVRAVTRDGVTRTSIYAHTPARLAWTLPVPAGGRLDLALSCLPGETVRYRVGARPGGAEGEVVLLDESVADGAHWAQRSVDLGRFAGASVELVLQADSEPPGAVALWGAPILSGSAAPPAERPNVILYVIDGGGADFMSVYGYNRRTTPFLERLAAEAVVFERAHSNSTWTQPSTASFMTGLQHSVLGGLRRGLHSTPVPAAATTMAEHLRRGGWETGAFTTNPNAARIIGLQRGVDVMRDVGGRGTHVSSPALHAQFDEFRRNYPGQPYWVHFQTTDVHEPNEPEQPFAGLYVTPAERRQLEEWDNELFDKGGDLFGTTSVAGFYDAALERAGIDRQTYFNTRRGLYDETMASQDRQLERFVQSLKDRGEWERTLLVITADHGHPAGTFARFGRGLLDPQPEPWQGALCDTYATHVPLIFVWPGHIAGGRRVEHPVALIDLLPTILELTGQPAPEVTEGTSLAPLLLADTAQRTDELARALPPVVLDEFRVDEASGEMIGNLELVDGRWGASLEIGPAPPGVAVDPQHGRHAVPAGGRWGAVHPFFPEPPRLLLYDLRYDPIATRAVNDEHPELVESYRTRLLQIWDEQRALAERFHETGGGVPMSPEQTRQLEALGYTGR